MTTKPETVPHGDAELLRVLAAHRKLVDEINADLHSPDGNVSKDATDREYALEDEICSRPAQTFEGVIVKLRLAAFQIKQEGKDLTEDRCTLSALEAVERLVGATQDGEPDKTVALEAEYRKENTVWDALSKDRTSGQAEAVGARVTAAIEAFATAPENSLEGIALKMKLLIEGMENQHSFEPELAQTALEGVERLIGKAS